MEAAARQALQTRFHLVNIQPQWLKIAIDEAKASGSSDIAAKVCSAVLHANLRDVSMGSLPANIQQKSQDTIKGPILAQIEELVNVAVPIEQRYSTSDDSKMRTFKLCLHDGAQQFFAIEWKKIPQLSANTAAGTKILLSNFTVRRGLALLSAENVRFLGGQVERLVSAAAIQRKKTEKSLVPEEWMTELGEMPQEPAQLAPSVPTQNIQPQPSRVSQPSRAEALGANSNRPAPPPNNSSAAVFIDDDMDDILANIELPDVAPPRIVASNSRANVSSERPVSTRPSTSSNTLNSTSASESAPKRRKMDDAGVLDLTGISYEALAASSPEDLAKLMLPNNPNNSDRKQPEAPISPTFEHEAAANGDESEIEFHVEEDDVDNLAMQQEPEPDYRELNTNGDDDIDFIDPDELAALEAAERAALDRHQPTNASPVSYLCDIMKQTHTVESVYKISGCIERIIAQFGCDAGFYSLDVLVDDGTGRCAVTLSDAVIESLVGMPAAEFEPYLNATETDTREIASGMLRQCEEALKNFCGLMEIVFGIPGHANPVITRLDFTEEEVRQDCANLLELCEALS